MGNPARQHFKHIERNENDSISRVVRAKGRRIGKVSLGWVVFVWGYPFIYPIQKDEMMGKPMQGNKKERRQARQRRRVASMSRFKKASKGM